MRLFIDDLRVPSDVGLIDHEWIIVRNYNDAIDKITLCRPQEISFDHDLGEEKTGKDITNWLINKDQDNLSDNFIGYDFKYNVHSANPIGKKNIEALLENYIKFKRS